MRLNRDLQAYKFVIAHKFIISSGVGNQLGYIRTCGPMIVPISNGAKICMVP